MTESPSGNSPQRPSWLQPTTETAMLAAYCGAMRAGQGGAAAIAAACTVLLARAPGLTPLQIGEALGIVAVTGVVDDAGQDATPSAGAAPGQRQSDLKEADDADLVAALTYALRHDERGRPRKGGWDFAAELAAEHLAGHLRRANFVVTRRRPGTPHSAG
jgi:hypothetical protein